MSTEAVSRVEVSAVGASAAETVVWRLRGELRVTVIVKAVFAFEADAPMRVVEPEDIVRAEVHHGRNPSRSVRLTSDLAPFLPNADVVLTGHACAPADETALGMSVRLAVYREQPLLDKSINVLCTTKDGDDEPFETMPLVYERAYGGVGFADNPFGLGVASPAGQSPNLVDPSDPQRVACFGPIARGWPNRKKLLGKADRKALDGPVAEIPEGFNFAYYQAAPQDQQVAYLQGNEWVVLEGMSRAEPQICSCLPSAIGRARVFGLGAGGQGRALALVADTLRIDADTLTCSVVWRGSFPVPDADTLARLVIHTGIDTAEKAIDWPPPPEIATPAPAPIAAVPVGKSVPPPAPAAVQPPAPVAVQPPAPVAVQPPAASAVQTPIPAPASAPKVATPAPAPKYVRPAWDRTIELPDQDEPIAAAPAVPFREGPSNLPPRPSRPEPKPDFARTFTTAVIVEQEENSPPTLPFVAASHRAAMAPIAPAAAPIAPAAAPLLVPLEAAMPAPLPAPKPAPKPVTTPEGIELHNETPLALGTVRWDTAPSRCALTVIAKATCDLVPDGPAAPRAATEPLSGERSAPGPRGALCAYPSDLAPFKTRADVVLAGHAHAPPGGASEMAVRFRFGDEGRGFDRALLVLGDRTWEPAGAALKPSAPARFLQMPLSFDRAFGGRGFDRNPLGLGFVAGPAATAAARRAAGPASPPPAAAPSQRPVSAPQRKPVPLPNLEDPQHRLRAPHQEPPPACFAPLASSVRKGAPGRDPADRSLPERFDWTRFQVAPPAQQTPFLRGDEPFEITGMHPKLPVLKGTLPGLQVRCFAERAPPDTTPAPTLALSAAPPQAPSSRPATVREEVPMHLDTVFFDLDERTLTLVWRGVLPVADEKSPDIRSLRLVTAKAGDEDAASPR